MLCLLITTTLASKCSSQEGSETCLPNPSSDFDIKNEHNDQMFGEDSVTKLQNKILDPNDQLSQSPDMTKEDAKESWAFRTAGGFGYSFSFIFLSEIGDKTFLFVILYSTKMKPLKLLCLASLVLGGLHVSGVVLGNTIQLLFGTLLVQIITISTFFIMGIFLLYDVYTSEDEEDVESKLKEVEEEAHINKNSRKETSSTDYSSDEATNEKAQTALRLEENIIQKIINFFASPDSVKVVCTLLAFEMGDRSQISAFGLGAQYNFLVVAIAGACGHILATLLAIFSGKAIASYTTERAMNTIGGILFLFFSAYNALEHL
ncbi:unnamed protein product [Moneuplotes crassus]|uniref:GDT1 family protein n=1 Tax=Euplotes crassus TaxID=5936 RepID=A0AAD1UIB4_EUPCR|nr:unnamed protein product [Moneuplotes crassus]